MISSCFRWPDELLNMEPSCSWKSFCRPFLSSARTYSPHWNATLLDILLIFCMIPSLIIDREHMCMYRVHQCSGARS